MNKVVDNASIVLLGSFNPSIFHPIWFEKQGLLPTVETGDAKIEVVSTDVAIFTLPWLRLEALRDRFVIRTSDESKHGPLRDLALGILRLLEHIPISQMGLNRDISYTLDSMAAWHAVGHKLAPKELWTKHLKEPGLLSLVMQGKRDDERKGFLNISIKPEIAIANTVTVGCNDHIFADENATALDIAKIIESDWDKSMLRAAEISSDLISSSMK